MQHPRLLPSPRRFIASLILLCAIPWTTQILAEGTQTGVLTGTVRDESGMALQGVVVEVQGPRSQRQAVTSAEGRFRFPALDSGNHSVRAELLELVAEQSDVWIFVGRSSDVDLVLTAPVEAEPAVEVEEWIQVIAEAPVIDRFDARVGATVPFELIDELPVERFYQSVALLLPGLSGGEDGNPNTGGALRSANRFLIDGVDTTDPTTGLFGLNLSYEAVREVQVTTAGATVDYGSASGAVINVVTRSGGNRFQGAARWVTGGGSLREDYTIDEDRDHLTSELEAANSGPGSPDNTLSLSLGGPLVPERLWLFAAHQDTQVGFFAPTLVEQPWDRDSQIEASAFKLTGQPTENHTVVAQHTRDASSFVSFSPFSASPGELRLPSSTRRPSSLQNDFIQTVPGEVFALEDNTQNGSFTKLEWGATWGQNLSILLTLADQDRELFFQPRNRRGFTGDAPHLAAFPVNFEDGDPTDIDLLLFLFNGATEEGSDRRPRRQGNLAIDSVVEFGGIEHELSFGIDYQETESATMSDVPGRDLLDPFLGIPATGQLFIDFDNSEACIFLGECQPFDNTSFVPNTLFNFWQRPAFETREETLAFYLSDRLIFDRWVVDLGVRYEQVEGEDSNGRPLVDDSDISPRVAVTYDPVGDGSTVLSFVWGRIHEPFLQSYLDGFGRAEPLTGFTEYFWDDFDFDDDGDDGAPGDPDGDDDDGGDDGDDGDLDDPPRPDCTVENPADVNSPCWVAVGADALRPLLFGLPNPDLERSSVEEWVFGYERQITPQTGFSVHYVDREWRDLWSGVERAVPGPSGEPDDFDIFVAVENLPSAKRSYRAIELLLQKRFADNWQLLASYTWSEAEGNLFRADGLSTFADFNEFVDVNEVNRLGPAPYDRPHQLGLFGTYRIPFGRTQLTLGTALRYRDGAPFHRAQFEDAGLRFLEPRGSSRLDGVFQWDLAATVDVRLASQLELELKAEVFNITNDQEQLAAETLLDTGLEGLARSIDDFQLPRALRFTLGLRF